MSVPSGEGARRAPEETYRHPYGGERPRPRLAIYDARHDTPHDTRHDDVVTGTAATDLPEAHEPEERITERLWQIREMSARAIGSIDDLLKRTA